LTACAAVNYVAPTTGKIAEISVSTLVKGDNMGVNIFKDDNCHFEESKLAGVLNSRIIGQESVDTISFSVQAEQPLIIGVLWGSGVGPVSSTCYPVAKFIPLEGHKYKATFSWITHLEQCVLEVTLEDGTHIPSITGTIDSCKETNRKWTLDLL